MFCPNYKNKQVFDGFNEMIEAFGGRPMTEEEFRDGDLRNQRSGLDYSAMEAAYITYDRNGGNFLDETPQGKPSLLFQTLLDHFNGDRAKAIVAKSNVYSDEFANWFGDWWGPLNVQDEDIKYGPISKVVDENGEPLVVWHHTNNKNLDEFRLDFKNYFKKDGGTNKAFFFDENLHGTLNRKYDLPVYLNIKNLNEYNETKEQLHNRGTSYRAIVNESAESDSVFDGVHMKDFDDNKMEHQSIWITHAPNQIKHVENLGAFNPNDPNIYHLKREVSVDEDTEYFNQTNIIDSFGQDLSQQLMNGETVSSKSLMQSMLSRGIFHSVDRSLARALSAHDIPVRIGYDMKNGELAKIMTDGKGSVIFINSEELSQVSRGYAGTALMHEIVHAITVDIINNPVTEEDKAFVESNRRVWQQICKKIKHLDVYSRDVADGLYALSSEKEFAAVFASDPSVRQQIYEFCEKIDRAEHGNRFVRFIKKMVNRLVKAFHKKAVFDENSLKSDIQAYDKILTKFLLNAPLIEKGNISSSSILKKVYKNSNKSALSHENFIETMKRLEKAQQLEKDYLLAGLRPKSKLDRSNTTIATIDRDVIPALQTRINALKTSNLDSITKGRLISTTDTQMQMFIVDEAGKYLAIQNILRTSVPYIIDTVDELRAIHRENGQFTNTDYMYQMHANVGMYYNVFEKLNQITENDSDRQRMVDEYNSRSEDKISVDDINAIRQNLKNAMSFAKDAMSVLEEMLKENVKYTLQKTAEEVGSVSMDSYIEALDANDGSFQDISMFELYAGASDASANEAVRALSYIINKALNKAQFDAQDKGEELLKLQDALKKGEKGWHLYETDENGDFTGYLIRDLNFGRFYKDYDNEIKRINKILIKEFGLTTLAEDNRVSPDGEDGRRTAEINGEIITAKEFFEKEKNKWLNTHAERKFKSEYYEYYSKLPQRVKDNLARIRTEIQAITSNYKDLYDENGVPHYEQLSEEDWVKINVLWERRRFLRRDIDEYGNKKEGEALKDAQALRELYENVYHIYEDPNDPRNKNKTKKYHHAAWLKARNEIKNKFGEDSEELAKWDERNTKKSLKKNEFGEALVFLKIEEEFGEQSISQEYGAEYQEYKEERRKILSNFKMKNGEYDHENIPQVLINALVELERKMRREATRTKNADSGLSKRAASYGEVFDKYIKYVDSVQLKAARAAAHEQAVIRAAEEDDLDPDALSVSEIETIILANSYGYLDMDDDLLDSGTFVPYTWLQRIEAKDPDLMEFEPNDAWIDREENDLENTYDPITKTGFNEAYGVALVPKRFDEHGNKLYDNTENYEKIFGTERPDGTREGGSETLQALYDGIQKTIAESNEAYGREYADNFLLPQVECTSMERFARKSTYRGIKNFFAKLVGYGRIFGINEDPNDVESGQNEVESTEGRYNKISGVYPDGRDFHIIPQYYTKKLKHPELISKDIVGITRDYYLMSRKYKERSEIKDDCEAIIDMLRRQQFKQGDRTVGAEKGESRTYTFAKQIAERDLYDMQRTPFGKTWLGRDISKFMALIKRYTTARNLGMNPKVAAVGFLTTSFTHIINGLVGYKYSTGDMFKAGLIVANEFGSNLFGARFIGNRLTKNKLMLLMEMLDMSDQSGRKTEHSNRNRILQAIYKNSTFGLLSAADIYSKATIMVATLLSYRYVDGRFMTKHMIEESRYSLGEEKYKQLIDEFKKSDINAYNIFEGDSKAWKGNVNSNDTKLHVKEEYKAAWEQIKHTAANKAIKNAEQADGMATRLQKAMMTRNFIGAFVLMHRQYIPLMLQQTWGKRVYDYDAQEYKGGQFRTLFEYVDQLCCSNALAAVGAGAFVGVAFGGFSTVPIVACSTAALARAIYNRVRGKKKTFKQVNEEFFGQSLFNTVRHNTRVADSGKSKSTEEHENKVANQYQIKQTVLEVALLNCFVAPLANLMCACADNTNKDDDYWKWLLLQTLAYWARAAQFETGTKYNLVDLSNNIKSASAVTAASDSFIDVATSLDFWKAFGINTAESLFTGALGYGKNYMASSITSTIYNTYMDETESDEDLIQSGPYKDRTKFFRAWNKALPHHNIMEQILSPELKRRYQENQVMKMSKEDKESMIYDFINYTFE